MGQPNSGLKWQEQTVDFPEEEEALLLSEYKCRTGLTRLQPHFFCFS